jgi:hypothetical protein
MKQKQQAKAHAYAAINVSPAWNCLSSVTRRGVRDILLADAVDCAVGHVVGSSERA